MKFKTKPVIKEAEQWFHGKKIDGVLLYTPSPWTDSEGNLLYGYVKTLEGNMQIQPGDWIITGLRGEKYPCKPDIFEATYEKVEE